MKASQNIVLTILLFLAQLYCPAQQLNFSPESSSIIRDSIKQSRWDIGGPLSQYSFRFMSEFFPVGIIRPSSKPFTFTYSPKKSIDQIMIKSKKDSSTLENYLKKFHIASFIVVKKGVIVYEKYFSMHPSDLHTLQSVTKVITSTLITSLINEKKIDIQQPIEKYIPELISSEWKGISLKDILNMRSGMDIRSVDFATGPFSNPAHKNYQLESALGILPKANNTPVDVFKFIVDLKKDTIAGLEAAYSNINTFVLGWLAEKVTGKKYVDLVYERIWQPMGASSNAYVCLSTDGVPWTHGGMSATLRDLARFGMLYTKTEIESRKESIVSLSQLKEIFDAPAIRNSFAPFKWAYQWDMASEGMMLKTGFGGQALYIDPKKEIVIAYYNYVDSDWGMNLVSESVINEILIQLDKER